MDNSKLPDDLKDMLAANLSSEGSSEDNLDKSRADLEKRKEEISYLAKSLIFGSVDDVKCRMHKNTYGDVSFLDCQLLKERDEMFNDVRSSKHISSGYCSCLRQARENFLF